MPESRDSLRDGDVCECVSVCCLFWDFFGMMDSLSVCVQNPEPGEMTMDEVRPNPMFLYNCLPTNNDKKIIKCFFRL